MITHLHDGKRRRSIWMGPAILTGLVLSIPLGRSLLAGEWGLDIRVFLLVGGVATVLFSIGLAGQMLIRKLGSTRYRFAVGVALMSALGIVWGNFVQAADGVTPNALYYLTAPMVGIVAAAAARFQSEGMARALIVAAAIQALVLTIVFSLRLREAAPLSAAVVRGLVGNFVHVLLLVGSALLFRKAARGEISPGVSQ